MVIKRHLEETESRHQNVSGIQIILEKRSIGESVCKEYSIVKESLPIWQSTAVWTLTICVLLLALSISMNSFSGILISVILSIILLYQLLWDVEKGSRCNILDVGLNCSYPKTCNDCQFDVAEVLLVTVPIGLQFTTTFKSRQQTTCFIPWHCIKNVYIIEAISLQRVLYNLVILTDGQEYGLKSDHPSEKLIPLFQGLKPRLDCLESIYQSIYNLLPRLESSECAKK